MVRRALLEAGSISIEFKIHVKSSESRAAHTPGRRRGRNRRAVPKKATRPEGDLETSVPDHSEAPIQAKPWYISECV
jgi:hypothetical protein